MLELEVDGDGPTISDVTPAHNTIQDSDVLRVAFTARDELSGLRHDAEQVLSEGPNYPSGDGDATVSNLDRDNFESNEPISDRDGRSTDINVWFGPDDRQARSVCGCGRQRYAGRHGGDDTLTTAGRCLRQGVIGSNFGNDRTRRQMTK